VLTAADDHVRAVADHRAKDGEDLDQDPGWVRLGGRMDTADGFSDWPVQRGRV
jgi:hypothetical protein